MLAVNTADMPGNEVRMWYNPDEMENRQRAVFMAGCAILDESLVTYLHNQYSPGQPAGGDRPRAGGPNR